MKMSSTLALSAILVLGSVGIGACSDNAGDQKSVEINADVNDTTVSNDVDEVGNGIDTAANAVGTGVENAGKAIGNAGAAAGAAISNTALEAEVNTKIESEPGLNDIDVDSEGEGTIVLSGTVASDAMKQHAEQVAMSVDGVVRVKNDLVVAK